MRKGGFFNAMFLFTLVFWVCVVMGAGFSLGWRFFA